MALMSRFGLAFVPRAATSTMMQQLSHPAYSLRLFSDAKDSDEPETTTESTPDVEDTETASTDSEEAEAPKSPDEIIEELNAQVKEHHAAVLRSLAEQENVRRIAKMDVDRARTYAVQSFAKNLLEVADNLERARTSVPTEVPDTDAPQFLKSLLEGVAMTDSGLHKVLTNSGVTKFGAVGDKFDPHIHEAMYQFQDAKLEPGTVGNVIAPGYHFKDRVLRPAKVGTVQAPDAP